MRTSRVRIVCTNRRATSDQRARGQHRRPRRFRHWVVDLEATPAKITWQQPVRRPNRFSPSSTLSGQSPSDWTRFSTPSCHSSCSGVASAFIWPGGSCLALALGHPSSAHSHRAGVPSSLPLALPHSHTSSLVPPAVLSSVPPSALRLSSTFTYHSIPPPDLAHSCQHSRRPFAHSPTSPVDIPIHLDLPLRASTTLLEKSLRLATFHCCRFETRGPRQPSPPHKAHRRRSPHDNPTALSTTANHNDFLLPLQRPPTTPNARFGIGGRSQPPRRPESESTQVVRLAKLAEAVPRCPEYEGARRVPDRAVLQDTVRGRCVV